MPFVIRRMRDKKFVARSDAPSLYTNELNEARAYDTLTAAEGDLCHGERILPLDYEGSVRTLAPTI